MNVRKGFAAQIPVRRPLLKMQKNTTAEKAVVFLFFRVSPFKLRLRLYTKKQKPLFARGASFAL